MNDLTISCTTLADYIDRTFKQMGLVESASDLLRHLQWEIEEYKDNLSGELKTRVKQIETLK